MYVGYQIEDGDEFDWEEYLESTNSDQAPDELFTAVSRM